MYCIEYCSLFVISTVGSGLFGYLRSKSIMALRIDRHEMLHLHQLEADLTSPSLTTTALNEGYTLPTAPANHVASTSCSLRKSAPSSMRSATPVSRVPYVPLATTQSLQYQGGGAGVLHIHDLVRAGLHPEPAARPPGQVLHLGGQPHALLVVLRSELDQSDLLLGRQRGLQPSGA